MLWMLRSAGWHTRTELMTVSSVQRIPSLRFCAGREHIGYVHARRPNAGLQVLEGAQVHVVDQGILSFGGRRLDQGVVCVILAKQLHLLALFDQRLFFLVGDFELQRLQEGSA